MPSGTIRGTDHSLPTFLLCKPAVLPLMIRSLCVGVHKHPVWSCISSKAQNRPLLSSTPTPARVHTCTHAHTHRNTCINSHTFTGNCLTHLPTPSVQPLRCFNCLLTSLSLISFTPAHPSSSLCSKSRKLCSFCSSSSGGCAAGHESVRAEVHDVQLSQRGCSDDAAPHF